MGLEQYFLLPRCPHPVAGETNMPDHLLPGVRLVAGPTPDYLDGRHVVQLTGTIIDQAVPTAANARADELVAAVAKSIEKKVDATAEAADERKAAADLAAARAELAKVRATRDAAKAAFDSAVAAGQDPRPHRQPLTAAETELADVEKWVVALQRTHTAAAAKRDAVRDSLTRQAAAGVQGDMKKRREKLQRRSEEVAHELASELLTVHAIEVAFRAK